MQVEIKLTDDDLDTIAERVALRLQHREEGNGQKLFNEKQVAKMLGVSVSYLKTLRQNGKITAYTKRRPILYDHLQIEALQVYLQEQK